MVGGYAWCLFISVKRRGYVRYTAYEWTWAASEHCVVNAERSCNCLFRKIIGHHRLVLSLMLLLSKKLSVFTSHALFAGPLPGCACSFSSESARFPMFTRLAAVKHVLRDIFHSVTIGAIRIMKIEFCHREKKWCSGPASPPSIVIWIGFVVARSIESNIPLLYCTLGCIVGFNWLTRISLICIGCKQQSGSGPVHGTESNSRCGVNQREWIFNGFNDK